MKARSQTMISSLILLTCLGLGANDGVDRYRKIYPNTYHLWPHPQDARWGYIVLEKDMPGGADGELKFRWSQPHLIALVRLAAQETLQAFGPAAHPLAIFDGSAENGDTPLDWDKGLARGRHPGGSHDGGINLDLGYYLTSLKGKDFNPDYAACTEHFQTGPDGKLQDVYICKGPADRLDVPRTSHFFLSFFRLNRELFEGDLIAEVGVDHEVRQSVLKQVRAWIQQKKHHATPQLLGDLERTLTCDDHEGWSHSHHHHTHLQLKDLDLLGRHRPALDKLLARERELDLRLAQHSPVLRARLLSTELQRFVEAEILPTGLALSELRFEIEGQPGSKPAQPGDPRNRAVLLLGNREAGSIRLRATFRTPDGRRQELKNELQIPGQDPRLVVAVDRSKLGGRILDDRAIADYPEVYRHLITSIELVLHRKGQDPMLLPFPKPWTELKLPGELHSYQKVDLRYTLSSRIRVNLPLFLKTNE